MSLCASVWFSICSVSSNTRPILALNNDVIIKWQNCLRLPMVNSDFFYFVSHWRVQYLLETEHQWRM